MVPNGEGIGALIYYMKKKIQPKCDRWKPVRNGDIYCSPACGGDCTFVDFSLANANAQLLCNRLDESTRFKGWKPHVWENLGWHFQASSPCGRISVYRHSYGKKFHYTAYLGAPQSGCGKWVHSANTPEQAIKMVIAMAKEEFAELKAQFDGL